MSLKRLADSLQESLSEQQGVCECFQQRKDFTDECFKKLRLAMMWRTMGDKTARREDQLVNLVNGGKDAEMRHWW